MGIDSHEYNSRVYKFLHVFSMRVQDMILSLVFDVANLINS